jgi:hypothetical protein
MQQAQHRAGSMEGSQYSQPLGLVTMQNMKWAVEVQKSGLARRNLGDLLTDLGFHLVDGIEFDAFTSPSLDQYDTAGEVWSEAKHLRQAFTGPAGIDPEFTLGSVIDYSSDPPKRHAFLEPEPIQITVSFGKPTLIVSPPLGLSKNQLAEWYEKHAEQEYQAKLEAQRAKLEPAYLCSRASKVLELLAIDDPTGETLYKIYELAEGHPSRRSNFHNRFGVSKDEFDRFGDAVHNPAVSGDWARHAYESKPRTSNPMSMNEAEAFIRELAKKWLASIRKARSE